LSFKGLGYRIEGSGFVASGDGYSSMSSHLGFTICIWCQELDRRARAAKTFSALGDASSPWGEMCSLVSQTNSAIRATP